MTITTQRVTCADCSRVSDVEIVTNAPIAVFIAAAKAARCPHCGSSKLGLGGSYNNQPPLTTPVHERAAWWIERGETGVSSKTIYYVLTGSNTTGSFGPDIPYDPDDLSRCLKLLALIPEWRSELHKVAERHPSWKPIVERWGKWETMFVEAHGKNYKTEKAKIAAWKPLYGDMQIAIHEAEKVSHA